MRRGHSNYWWPCNSSVTTHRQIYDQTKFHMVKSIDNTLWNCVLSYKQKTYFSEKWLVLPRNYLITEFRGSYFTLSTYLTGSKWYFQWANLLLPLSVLNPGYTTEVLVDDYTGNTLEGDVSDVIALDQLTSPFSPRKATKMSPYIFRKIRCFNIRFSIHTCHQLVFDLGRSSTRYPSGLHKKSIRGRGPSGFSREKNRGIR